MPGGGGRQGVGPAQSKEETEPPGKALAGSGVGVSGLPKSRIKCSAPQLSGTHTHTHMHTHTHPRHVRGSYPSENQIAPSNPPPRPASGPCLCCPWAASAKPPGLNATITPTTFPALPGPHLWSVLSAGPAPPTEWLLALWLLALILSHRLLCSLTHPPFPSPSCSPGGLRVQV